MGKTIVIKEGASERSLSEAEALDRVVEIFIALGITSTSILMQATRTIHRADERKRAIAHLRARADQIRGGGLDRDLNRDWALLRSMADEIEADGYGRSAPATKEPG